MQPTPLQIARTLPPSVSGWLDPLLILLTVTTSYCLASITNLSDQYVAIVVILSVLGVLGLVEINKGIAEGRIASHPLTQERLQGAVIGWAGTMVGFFIVLAAWYLLPEYSRSYYSPLKSLLGFALIAFPLVSLVGYLAGARYVQASGSGYELGKYVVGMVSGKVPQTDWPLMRTALLSWLIRGFFLPINFIELVYTIGDIRGHELAFITLPFGAAVTALLTLFYFYIIAAVAPGYLVSSKLLNTHVRDADSTAFGWLVTIMCYSPFSTVMLWRFFDYRADTAGDTTPWIVHLEGIPVLLVAFGITIVLSEVIHLWAEAQFGLRSSNLSNRGIITTGPLRFFKHPVYLSKCVGWFCIWVPFMAGKGALESLHLTVLFAGVCVIYYLRAHAEEKLLSKDPAYVQYALWMDRHGVLSFVNKLVPALSFEKKFARWNKPEAVAIPAPIAVVA